MERKQEIAVRALWAINRILERDFITKSSLAKELDSKPAKFTEILSGRMFIPVEMMSLLCEKYNVSPDYLLCGRGEAFIENDGNEYARQAIYNLTIENTRLKNRIAELEGKKEAAAS